MDLEFTRGDTQFLTFQLKDFNENLLSLTESECLYFSVKQNANSKKLLIQKKFPDDIVFSSGFFVIELSSEDTSSLPYGTYQYDIELKCNDFVRTLAFGTITLTEEITFRRDEK